MSGKAVQRLAPWIERQWARLLRRLQRSDSLFMRIATLQVALAIGLSTLFFGIYYVDRNRTVAALLAERWAGALQQVAQAADDAPGSRLITDPPILRRMDPPPSVRPLTSWAPRVQTLTSELAARGVQVDVVALSGLGNEQPQGGTLVWMHVLRPSRSPLWLGARGPFVEAHAVLDLVLTLVLATGLVMGLSWFPARRMASRLERLRMRIRSGQLLPPEAPDLGATPELIEIERAYDDLLERVLRQQSERALLLAGVSHDLRSPLGRIRMAAELLPDDAATAGKRASIVANVQAADRLIESFLDLVRSTELPLDQAVDVADAARQVAAGFTRDSCDLSVEAPDTLELAQANQHLIERALYNLIDNALKHGRVPVVVRVREDAASIVIEARDHGPGMPEAMRAAMLQAFARGDASRGKPGSGLGLAVVQQVAERLRGRVEFEQGEGWWLVRLRVPGSSSNSSGN